MEGKGFDPDSATRTQTPSFVLAFVGRFASEAPGERMRLLVPFALAVLAAGCTTAQPRHHLGFQVSGDLGVAGSRSSMTTYFGTRSVSGTGATFGLAVGHRTAPDFILGAQLWGAAAPRPKVKSDRENFTPANDFTYGVIGIGPVAKYYFMPANVYVSVTPSLTRVALSNGRDDFRGDDAYRARVGVGLRAAIGREWSSRVDRWTFGIGGVFHCSTNEDSGSGSSAPWKSVGGGVVFSASMD